MNRAARLQLAMMTRGADFADAGSRMVATVKAEVAEAPSPSPDGHYNCLMPSTGISPAAFALECRNLSFAYKRGAAREIEDLTLSVACGEVVALCGPNGCGKSTFLKLVAGVSSRCREKCAYPAGHSIKPTATKLSGLSGCCSRTRTIRCCAPTCAKILLMVRATWGSIIPPSTAW